MAPATSRSKGGLSAEDIEMLRSTLEAGRKPKVMFTESAGQMAGQIGQLVHMEDPTVSDEWLVVRFGRDELPFAPQDLQIPPKAPSKRTQSSESGSTASSQANTGQTGEDSSSSSAPPGPPLAPSFEEQANQRSSSRRMSSNTGTPSESRGRATTETSSSSKRSPKKGKAPSELTITLAWHEGEWEVSATRGSRVITKPTPVRAHDALKMVQVIGEPTIRAAVDEIVATARSEAEETAERLRRELAEVEARLAELDSLG